MAGERQINWGVDETDATYVTGDAGDGGPFVVAEDTDGSTILLQWNPTAGEWEFGGPVGDITSGRNPAEQITESSTPKALSFSGSQDRDIHDETDVTISNSSGASETEDITVTLYDGVDNTGTQIATETLSVTVADASSVTETFLTTDQALDTGDYFVEVTQSGTALTVDSATEKTKGATHTLSQTDTGEFEATNQDGTVEQSIDPITGRSEFPAVSAETADITESLTHDLSTNNPHQPRGPEAGGGRFWKPFTKALTPSEVDAAESSYTVTDCADPFFHKDGGEFVILFEIITQNNGTFNAAASSTDPFTWGSSSYDGILTADGNEIASSYPHALKWGGEWWMSDETGQLKRATNWPMEWTVVEDLTNTMENGGALIDSTFFRFGGRWWSVAGDSNDNIVFEHSEQTDGGLAGRSWSEPTWSPITTETGSGSKRESPAGKAIPRQDGVLLHFEDESRSNNHVSQYQVTELSTDTAPTIVETETSPATFAWGGFGTSHQLDPLIEAPGDQPVAVTDVGTPWEVWIAIPSERYPTDTHATNTGSQTVSAGTGFNDVQFDSTFSSIDFLGNFDTSNYLYNVPSPGFYETTIVIGISSFGSGNTATAVLGGDGEGRHEVTGQGDDAYLQIDDYNWFGPGDQIGPVQVSASGGDASLITNQASSKFIVKKR